MDGWIINGRSQTKLAKQKIERRKKKTEQKRAKIFFCFMALIAFIAYSVWWPKTILLLLFPL